MTGARLREIYEELIAQGAACIDLVTPTHFLPVVLESLSAPLGVPVVWNCGGYEKPETLKPLHSMRSILPISESAIRNAARNLKKPEKPTRNISAS